MKVSLIPFIGTLLSGIMLRVVGVHAIEDTVLLSIGKFSPLPWYGTYAVGLTFSWIVLGLIIHRLLGDKRNGRTHGH